jgi:hypothetical protein
MPGDDTYEVSEMILKKVANVLADDVRTLNAVSFQYSNDG